MKRLIEILIGRHHKPLFAESATGEDLKILADVYGVSAETCEELRDKINIKKEEIDHAKSN